MNDEQRKIRTTTDGQPPTPGLESAGAPQPINPETGQHRAYWVLSAEERAKGFIRPVRQEYRHVGAQPRYPLRDLTIEEEERYADCGYHKFEVYPESESPRTGRFWTKAELEKKACGTTTKMSLDIAQTYARNPNFYGSTFCCHCRAHLPVGQNGEFIWLDGGRDTDERVGT